MIMFLCRFIRRHRRLQILVHSITFEQRFGFLLFLARLLALTYRLPASMLVDFRSDLDLELSRSNMEFAISRPKWSDCHGTKNKYINWTRCLKCDHQIWPWPWPWPLNFQGQVWPWHLTTHIALAMDNCYLIMGGPIDIEQRRWK